MEQEEIIKQAREEMTKYLYNLAQIPGTAFTPCQLFQLLRKNGIQIYLIGGLVRRIISAITTTKTFEPPRDIDVAFSVDAYHVYKLLKSNNITCRLSNEFVIIGRESQPLYLEGSHVQYSVKANPVHWEFTINSIFFDLDQQQFVNPHYVHDIINKRLRPAVGQRYWTQWLREDHIPQMKFNKILRFWLMKSMGYQPPKKFNNYMLKSIRALFDANSVPSWTTLVHSLWRTKKHDQQKEWMACVCADMGPEWYAIHMSKVIEEKEDGSDRE